MFTASQLLNARELRESTGGNPKQVVTIWNNLVQLVESSIQCGAGINLTHLGRFTLSKLDRKAQFTVNPSFCQRYGVQSGSRVRVGPQSRVKDINIATLAQTSRVTKDIARIVYREIIDSIGSACRRGSVQIKFGRLGALVGGRGKLSFRFSNQKSLNLSGVGALTSSRPLSRAGSVAASPVSLGAPNSGSGSQSQQQRQQQRRHRQSQQQQPQRPWTSAASTYRGDTARGGGGGGGGNSDAGSVWGNLTASFSGNGGGGGGRAGTAIGTSRRRNGGGGGGSSGSGRGGLEASKSAAGFAAPALPASTPCAPAAAVPSLSLRRSASAAGMAAGGGDDGVRVNGSSAGRTPRAGVSKTAANGRGGGGGGPSVPPNPTVGSMKTDYNSTLNYLRRQKDRRRGRLQPRGMVDTAELMEERRAQIAEKERRAAAAAAEADALLRQERRQQAREVEEQLQRQAEHSRFERRMAAAQMKQATEQQRRREEERKEASKAYPEVWPYMKDEDWAEQQHSLRTRTKQALDAQLGQQRQRRAAAEEAKAKAKAEATAKAGGRSSAAAAAAMSTSLQLEGMRHADDGVSPVLRMCKENEARLRAEQRKGGRVAAAVGTGQPVVTGGRTASSAVIGQAVLAAGGGGGGGGRGRARCRDGGVGVAAALRADLSDAEVEGLVNGRRKQHAEAAAAASAAEAARVAQEVAAAEVAKAAKEAAMSRAYPAMGKPLSRSDDALAESYPKFLAPAKPPSTRARRGGRTQALSKVSIAHGYSAVGKVHQREVAEMERVAARDRERVARQERRYMRDALERRRKQVELTQFLVEQVREKKARDMAAKRDRFLHSRVEPHNAYPMEAERQHSRELGVKEHLRRSLDAQVAAKEGAARRAREEDISTEKQFLASAQMQMALERRQRLTKKVQERKELTSSWQKQAGVITRGHDIQRVHNGRLSPQRLGVTLSSPP